MITVSKPKLPKHLSYPLKTSMLEEALRDAGIESDISLNYRTPRTGHSVLLALLRPPNVKIDHTRVYIRVGVVPAQEKRPAALQIEQKALPAFVSWLAQYLNLPPASPAIFHEPWFEATWKNGELLMTQGTMK